VDDLIRHLREARYAQGLTQAEVADAAGLSRGHIRDWECGYNVPLISSYERWARALGFEVTLSRQAADQEDIAAVLAELTAERFGVNPKEIK
jgi:transcriptional regulator with XRE-family HTH domain